MGKFAKEAPLVASPVTSTGDITSTHEGGVGYVRDAKSELYLLAVTNMVGEGTFYECAEVRDGRFQALIHQVTQEDPKWIAGFVPYLRNVMQMRSAPVVMAAEYVKAGGPEGRVVISSALSRPDEPGEMLAYWFARYGRNLPAAVKRGVADAAVRLYNEKSLLKYDTPGPWRFGNVILLTHPKAKGAWQAELFKQAIARHNDESRPLPVDGSDGEAALPTLDARQRLSLVKPEARRGVSWDFLQQAGITWEAYSAWLEGPMDAQAWETVIPSMPYMARLRNLRNFEEAGVNPAVLEGVAQKLCDPEQVARSRQFPIRFLSAWKATGSMTFGPALEKAVQLSLANVPSLPGRTLVLIDCSGSMFPGYFGSGVSDKSKVARFELAGVFGASIAIRAEDADLYAYGSTIQPIGFSSASSVLRLVSSLENLGGTETWAAVRAAYQGHDRIIILTDEQAFRDDKGGILLAMSMGLSGSDRTVPSIYTFNVAGYRAGHSPSGRDGRHTFGGLTDAAFRMIPLLEAGRSARWPWLETPAS